MIRAIPLADGDCYLPLKARDARLHQSFPGDVDLRVPGSLDGFKLAVRIVLGQQITVAATRTLAQRLVKKFDQPIQTPWPDSSRCPAHKHNSPKRHQKYATKAEIMKFDPATVQTTLQSPLGPMVLAATHHGLAGLWFVGQRHYPAELAGPPVWATYAAHPVLQKAAAQLTEYFAGQRKQFDLPLDLAAGTAFQQAVWQALLTIPPGKTLSYGEVSYQIGKPAAVRAVGAAIGRNPISIIVPCHRVIGGSGQMTGYAGGLERKTGLLQLEGALETEVAAELF